MKYSILIILCCLLLPQSGIAESGATLERIKETGVVRIGFREAEPPMSFLDKDNKPVGYSIDLCIRIVNEVKQTLGRPEISTEYVPVTSSNRFQAIIDGKIDILCGATTKTLSRAELVDFTQLTFVTGASLMSLDETPVEGVSDLQGKKVGVVRDTTTLMQLNRILKESVVAAEVVQVDSASAGMQALVAGELAAFASDQVVLIGLALTHQGDEKFVVADDIFSFEPFALAVKKGDSDFRLVADRALSRLNRSAQITPIYAKWFGKFSKRVPTMLEAMYLLTATPE